MWMLTWEHWFPNQNGFPVVVFDHRETKVDGFTLKNTPLFLWLPWFFLHKLLRLSPLLSVQDFAQLRATCSQPQPVAFQQLLQLPSCKRRLLAKVERKRSAEQWAKLCQVNANKQWNKKSKQKAGLFLAFVLLSAVDFCSLMLEFCFWLRSMKYETPDVTKYLEWFQLYVSFGWNRHAKQVVYNLLGGKHHFTPTGSVFDGWKEKGNHWKSLASFAEKLRQWYKKTAFFAGTPIPFIGDSFRKQVFFRKLRTQGPLRQPFVGSLSFSQWRSIAFHHPIWSKFGPMVFPNGISRSTCSARLWVVAHPMWSRLSMRISSSVTGQRTDRHSPSLDRCQFYPLFGKWPKGSSRFQTVKKAGISKRDGPTNRHPWSSNIRRPSLSLAVQRWRDLSWSTSTSPKKKKKKKKKKKNLLPCWGSESGSFMFSFTYSTVNPTVELWGILCLMF